MNTSKHHSVRASQHQSVDERRYHTFMDGIGDRVRGERVGLGLSQQELAVAVTRKGFTIGQSGIGNIESHRTKNPKCIPELASALGVSVAWLRTGQGEKTATNGTRPPHDSNGSATTSLFPQDYRIQSNVRHLDPQNVTALRSEMPKDIPVLGTVSGGSGGVHMANEAIDFARRPPALDGRTDVFGLYVEDVSMAPAFNPGDLVLVEGKPPRGGDHVVVEFKDSAGDDPKAILKRLKAMTPTVIKLEQYNPPRTIEVKRAHLIRMRRVLTMMDLFGV
jgi:phage repressor protein C with HTH and peptisase S24 domain